MTLHELREALAMLPVSVNHLQVYVSAGMNWAPLEVAPRVVPVVRAGRPPYQDAYVRPVRLASDVGTLALLIPPPTED